MRDALRRTSPGTLVLAFALGPLVTHAEHLPRVTIGAAADLDVKTADLAVVAVVAAAALAARGGGARRLRASLPLYAAAALFLAWLLATVALAAASGRPYATASHAVSAAAVVEYALLAVVVPLVVRSRNDLVVLLASLTAWAGLAALVALAQFAGLDVLEASRRGHRQPSFVGYHDLAALSGAAFAAGAAVLAWGVRRRVGVPAAVVGGLGLALSGSVAGLAGTLAGLALVLVVGRRRRSLSRDRAAALLAGAALVTGAVLGIRGGDLADFLRFAATDERVEDVESYSHRTLLTYLGARAFADHPLAGAGWHATFEYENLEPYLDDARRRYPDVAAEAFPTPERPWGIQNAYVQIAAELGVVGVVLAAALAAAALVAALRPPSLVGLAAASLLLVCGGVLAAEGVVAATPLQALLWLAIGLAATARAGVPDV
jgi:O-antigen ligase